MKTRNVVSVIGAVALAAVILKLNAAAPVVSPPANDRQTKALPTPASDRNLPAGNRNSIGSSQAADNVAKALPDTEEDRSLAKSGHNVIFCPRGNEAISQMAVAGDNCAAATIALVAPPACCAKQ